MLDRLIISPGCVTDIDEYERLGGYAGLRKAAAMKPMEIADAIIKSGLRGRGGAGFPTGRKWLSVLQDPKTPKYLICNADEGEPGTFKDRYLLEKNPHILIEGMAIAALAVGASTGYIYLRGEYPALYSLLEDVIAQAISKSYLGRDILGTGQGLALHIHRGAGAYICGEETALIESLEGKRGQPRSRPPYTVNEGYMRKPTLSNNVETFANAPIVLNIGPEAYSKIGTKESPGPKLFAVSGHVAKPGVYELPMGTALNELIYEHCGGISGGKALKGVIPGGVSTAVLGPDALACRMDFTTRCEGFASILGSGAVIVFDDETCMVNVALRIAKFFSHESCGKCTPCREGTDWIRAVLQRIENGQGDELDLKLLVDIADNIKGKSFCALGDGAAISALSFLNTYRDEFMAHITGHGCPMAAAK